jgi:hypothetical protein
MWKQVELEGARGMDFKRIESELKPIEDKLLSDLNWYQAKTIDIFTEELYQFLQKFHIFNASFHYHVTFEEWNHYRTYNDCQMSAGELVRKLFELQREHGNSWVFYIENGQGDPVLFIEFDGYMFNYDIIAQGDW